MQPGIDISPDVLNWVIAQTRSVAVPPYVAQYFREWKSGEKKPTFNQIEKVGNATGIPLGYFFLKRPPQEDIHLLDYRTIDSVDIQTPSRNLVDTIHNMELIQDWVRDNFANDNPGGLQFVGCHQDKDDIIGCASSIRKALDINIKWFEQTQNTDGAYKYFRQRISNLGILVMMSGIVENNTHRPLDTNEFRAFALVDKYAPLIFINTNDSANGRLFSLLHELVHIWIGENDLYNDRYSTAEGKVRKTETFCNGVAAEILVPQEVFISSWNYTPKEELDEYISTLAEYFKCGTTVIARKALDNDLVTTEQYKTIAHAAVSYYLDAQRAKKEQGQGGGDFYNTAASRIDNRFFLALLESVNEGKTLYSDAFRLTNTNRSTFANLAERIRGDE